jgi:hypothetical protein
MLYRSKDAVSVNELVDYSGTLDDLLLIIQNQIKIFGKDAPVYFDAGYNNVEVVITPQGK